MIRRNVYFQNVILNRKAVENLEVVIFPVVVFFTVDASKCLLETCSFTLHFNSIREKSGLRTSENMLYSCFDYAQYARLRLFDSSQLTSIHPQGEGSHIVNAIYLRKVEL